MDAHDAGVAHGLARFSGSETDLANLALRVAISEHVRFQSGGAVGLLVLDEVFGPLDPDRRDRMLQALNRLGSRFRQVLVITHLPQIAARSDRHLVVSKKPRGGLATSDVAWIHGEDRVAELARMLGDPDGEAARRHALAMLGAAAG